MVGLKPENWVGLVANTLLFLSSLLLIIDVAPRDFSPTHRRRVEAIAMLHQQRNVLGMLPAGVQIRPETERVSIAHDQNTFEILSTFTREQAPVAQRIEWRRVVGVGYTAVRVSVGDSQLEAVRPLYVVLLPQGNSDRMSLEPVGQLGDLDDWLTKQRPGVAHLLGINPSRVWFLLSALWDVPSVPEGAPFEVAYPTGAMMSGTAD